MLIFLGKKIEADSYAKPAPNQRKSMQCNNAILRLSECSVMLASALLSVSSIDTNCQYYINLRYLPLSLPLVIF